MANLTPLRCVDEEWIIKSRKICVRCMQYQLNILLDESYWTTKMKYNFVLYKMCAIFL